MRLLLLIKRIILLLLLSLVILLVKQKLRNDDQNDTKIILWWTNFYDFDHTRNCGGVKCIFTENRTYLNNPNLKAFLFYGSNMNTSNFPLPRMKHHIWALLHEESPKNNLFIMYPAVLTLFNVTSTFSRYSNSPLTLQYLNSMDDLISTKYYITVDEKNSYQNTENLAPILYIQSICNTMSRRDEYISELSKYIKIDSYGKCLNNKKLPDSLSNDYLSTIESEEFYKFISKYKFVISYENAVCNDYITEKFWRPIIVGTVPIYFGTATIKDWLPNKKSAILISDFDSPKKLAEFIKYLDSNDLEYMEYLKHKTDKTNPISNSLLIQTLYQRNKDFEMLETFECLVCQLLSVDNKESIVSEEHYNCNQKLTYPKMNFYVNDDKFWEESLQQGKCEANIINEFIHNNRKYTDEDFNNELLRRYTLNLC